MINLEKFKERLVEVIHAKKLNRNAFCYSIGLSHGYLNTNSKTMQSDKLAKIVEIYPDINILWLLSGRGKMFNDEEIKVKESTTKADKDQEKTITLLKDELSETRAKLIRCMEQKEKLTLEVEKNSKTNKLHVKHS